MHVIWSPRRRSALPGHYEPDTVGAAGAASATSQNEAGMQQSSWVQGEPFPSYHGRTVSWVAVGIIVIGFVLGGLGLMVDGHGGPIWWLFWTGAGVAVLGLLLSLVTNTFEDWY
jgi:hypothetical protein